jgi:uncharacterized protein (TIGR02466 family)
MITDQNVLPLFAIPLCRTNIGAVSEDTEHYLKQKIEYTQQRQNSHNSKNLNILDDPKCVQLKQQIHTQLMDFLHYLDVNTDQQQFYITTSWMNKYSAQQTSHEHYHSNSLISGVLYFDDCEETAGVTFHKRQGWDNLFQDTVNVDHNPVTDQNKMSYVYHHRTITIQPSRWDLILFPSVLNHSVPANLHPDRERYSLAFNSFLKGHVGDSGSRLEIN